MITQQLANELLIQLWQLFPKSDDDESYQDVIARTLAKRAQDGSHAATAVQRLVETCRFKPLPVEVIDAINATQPAAEEQWPEPWTPQRGPDDEPFNGLADLIDDRILELLQQKAEHGRTQSERRAAAEFLRLKGIAWPTCGNDSRLKQGTGGSGQVELAEAPR